MISSGMTTGGSGILLSSSGLRSAATPWKKRLTVIAANDAVVDLISQTSQRLSPVDCLTSNGLGTTPPGPRAREKSFQFGDHVLIFTPDSTSSKLSSRWSGPAVIKDKVSVHSYLLDMNSAVKHLHADTLRKYQ